MKKNRTGMPRLMVVLSLALAGLMLLQILLLKYAWDLKEQAFTGGAQSALAATVTALESREIEGTAFEYMFGLADSAGGAAAVSSSAARGQAVTRAPAVTVSPRAERFPVFETRRKLHRLRETTIHRTGEDSIMVVVAGALDPHQTHVGVHTYRKAVLRDAVGQWVTQVPGPIEERLDRQEIAAVLQDELAKVGITTVPRFGVIKPGVQDVFEFAGLPEGGYRTAWQRAEEPPEVVLASDHVTAAELLDSPYRQQLFPLDPFSSPYDLAVVFPGDKIYLFWQIWPLWLASVLFMSVIILSFARAWRTNAEQRRFADQLVDFINNMTHEFKTPISTVGLAGEAITREDVQQQPEIFARYVDMIRDENRRMHRQVEKILQMARFERGDIELKREVIRLHDLLGGVASSFALVVEQRGGSLTEDLAAPADSVLGDRVHLQSIFSNLVDNAVKYSPAAPRIKIATSVMAGYLVVKVSDLGRGISRENQRRVFEKYYRCPTGNRHDVKGYGLGLSFVQRLVTAHGGFVELHSLPGEGTTVTVSLPVLPDPEETA